MRKKKVSGYCSKLGEERKERLGEERRDRMKLIKNLQYYSKYFQKYHIFINIFKIYNIMSIFPKSTT